MSIYPYKTPEVRDLAWACFSPPLLDTPIMAGPMTGINNCALKMNPRREKWLLALDDEPSKLLSHLEQSRSPRLGLYFESLWHFFLSQDPDVELIAHNLPVRDAGRTIGEFDCIYYCRKRNHHIHLELAVKFYLGYPRVGDQDAQSPWRDWLGPNSKDRLDKKILRLTDHQIRLGEHPASAPLLRSLNIDELFQEIEVKGYLFAPLSKPMPAPFALAGGQILHRWLGLNEFIENLDVIDSAGYQILSRLDWLSPISAGAGEDADTGPVFAEMLAQEMATDHRARLIAGIDQNGKEITRFFVVEDGWPSA